MDFKLKTLIFIPKIVYNVVVNFEMKLQSFGVYQAFYCELKMHNFIHYALFSVALFDSRIFAVDKRYSFIPHKKSPVRHWTFEFLSLFNVHSAIACYDGHTHTHTGQWIIAQWPCKLCCHYSHVLLCCRWWGQIHSCPFNSIRPLWLSRAKICIAGQQV